MTYQFNTTTLELARGLLIRATFWDACQVLPFAMALMLVGKIDWHFGKKTALQRAQKTGRHLK